MSPILVKEWFKRLKGGCESYESAERPGRPLASKRDKYIDLMRVAMLENCKPIIQELVDDFLVARYFLVVRF